MTPKGVILSHRHLLCNTTVIENAFGGTRDSSIVIWLPPYHDMGLTGGILQPLYSGVPVVLMAPSTFLRRPASWLRAISKYRAQYSGGPRVSARAVSKKGTRQGPTKS